MEMSKGTAFFQNEQKKAEQVDKHVAQMKKVREQGVCRSLS